MVRTLLSAHQTGFESGFAPNSLQSVLAVRDDGVDMIEFDVRVTRDNKFVTLHDAELKIDGRSVAVESLDSTEVLHNAPTACLLRDMLLAIKDHAIAHVDIKDTRMELEIVDLCEDILGPHNYIITTLEDGSVAKIRDARPNTYVALSLGRDVRGLGPLKAIKIRLSEIFPARRVARCRPTMLAMNYHLAKYGTLRWAKRRKLPVLLWTINSPKLMHKVWANPYVWAFTTNYPRQALNESHHHAKLGIAKFAPETIE